MALTARQTRVYTDTVTIWRQTPTLAADGKLTGVAWAVVASGVKCHINSDPSNFGLSPADALLSESDNMFTLDKFDFESSVDIQATDVIKLTAGSGPFVGQFWRVRGDRKPKTWHPHTNKIQIIAARLMNAPTGVS